jgi:hypothetical protein
MIPFADIKLPLCDEVASSSWLIASTLFVCFTAGTFLSQRLFSARNTAEAPLFHDFEASLIKTNNILLALSGVGQIPEGFDQTFCGIVSSDISTLSLAGKKVYLCGDISKAGSLQLSEAGTVLVVRDISHNYEDCDSSWESIDSAACPMLIHGVGVYYRRFFDPSADYFNKIREDHEFQSLTESTKPGTAHRTGIYLTPVVQDGEDRQFHLLRCSSNLSGPTANFRDNDYSIVNSLNKAARSIFHNFAEMNHVLAQIYHNTPAGLATKEKKAKIKDHSDKTKDMPRNGVMGFCTFYDQKGLDKLQPMGPGGLDYGRSGVSGLTKLHFRLKPDVARRHGCTLEPQFCLTLYPNSVFLMPLSTNRLYTHEIKPAALNANILPTRMGYVVRCSNTEAIHRDGCTFLKVGSDKDGDALVEMKQPTADGMKYLRQKYAEENATSSIVQYGQILFSMNKGDYKRPLVYNDRAIGQSEFYVFDLSPQEYGSTSIYDDLLGSVVFEDVCKGRKGAVLVMPDAVRGIPIVRTTTKYSRPAFAFKPIHVRLAEHIRQTAHLSAGFNNALIEKYTNQYVTMGFHSDQALDLEAHSYIAVFSCYKDPEIAKLTPRKLVVESKEKSGCTFEIPMTHNSVIVFSLGTNCRFKHKIVLDSTTADAENEWLGVTFRLSKTFIQQNGEKCAYFEDGTPFTTATIEQAREFYKLRKAENQEIDFDYPPVTYTISGSDILPPRS